MINQYERANAPGCETLHLGPQFRYERSRVQIKKNRHDACARRAHLNFQRCNNSPKLEASTCAMWAGNLLETSGEGKVVRGRVASLYVQPSSQEWGEWLECQRRLVNSIIGQAHLGAVVPILPSSRASKCVPRGWNPSFRRGASILLCGGGSSSHFEEGHGGRQSQFPTVVNKCSILFLFPVHYSI
ncbi:uncharacterized protein K444DRAFT_617522 [Hyaloscypha bicolor E]|uniref:Uncharacterized protein n=1 Tax=Hyaloscypha bicolor E TaxID=1095630 RepID=A0A2J6SWC1_9HELO|nr:uncharacterized protein K444DRAFT_617522 [Hyaloscypha bicolor E]PMD55079.1 hypothetical protein K444DRAFT_617522 [Hyaloscypha bicolor E]